MKKSKVSCHGSLIRRLSVALTCMLTGIGLLQAQPITVTGTVTSASDGEPLIGATVRVIDTNVGTATDVDGNFSIKAEVGARVAFTYIGYMTREVKVTGDRLDVALQENSSVLDEVVVVGYGVQKKKLVTGATSQVKGEEIAKMNTTSPLQAMQGQMPGVNITSESGAPGAGMKVNIRGLGTVGNSGPLYLIDGIKGDIANVNPADIESIDVLKDAASAAIYGAQAANGVVLVTTKSGKEGKAKVTFDGYFGWQTVAHKANMLNAREYMTIMDESNINSGGGPFDWASMKSIYRPDGSLIDTDWLDEMFSNGAKTQSYTLGVTGGSATSTYAISAGYLNQEGIVGGPDVSNFSRYNFRVNSDHKLFGDILEIGEQMAFVYSKQQGQDIGNQYYGMTQTLKGAFNTSPLAPVYDAEGNLNNTSNSDWYKNDGNPYGSMQVFKYNQNKNGYLTANAYVQLQPIKNLRIRSVFGVNYTTSENRSYTPLYEFSPYIQNVSRTSVSQGMNRGLELTWTNTASYEWKINFTLRNDGSSKFARGHRHGWFPSVSAGWNLSSESFMEGARSWLSFLKIRVSYGKVGNQNIDNYRFLSPIQIANTHYFYGQYMGPNGVYNGGYSTTLENYWGAYPNRLGNMDLTWESSEQFDAGFDARFLDGRLTANFDFYIKNTKNWLVQAPILATAGTDAPFINGGNVKNTGVELSLGWSDVVGNDFSYNVSVNGAYNHNRVGSIPTQDGIIHGATNQLYDNAPEFFRAENGHPIGYFWGYQTAGIFQNQAQIDAWKAAGNGILQANPVPGDVIFVDRDHNGMIDDADKTDLGNGIPKFTYGINVNLYWKNFDLGIVGVGQAGNKIVQSYRNQGNSQANYTTAILNRWTGEGTSNKMPRVTNDNINWQFSDLYLQDGDFFRISNLTLGYNFAPLINQKWLSNCRLYFQVQNVFTFTKYDGMDPEIGYGTQSWVSGVDLGFYPRSRTYLFGVNLAF